MDATLPAEVLSPALAAALGGNGAALRAEALGGCRPRRHRGTLRS